MNAVEKYCDFPLNSVQKEVFDFIIDGKSIGQISELTGFSEIAVSMIAKSAAHRLGADNIAQATVIYAKLIQTFG